MDPEVDHYRVLGLPSGEEGANLSEKEISKAYRQKALELHPDKRPDDPNAHANFQKLKSSYEVLRDDKVRKLFDELLRVRREKQHRERQFEAKRQRMVSDLEKREKESFYAPDPERKAKEEEERIKRKLQEEIARIRAMHSKTKMPGEKEEVERKRKTTENASSAGGLTLDKTKVLKVTWEKGVGDYSASRLREVFEEFGEVEDVLIKSSKKKGSALVVMSSKEAALAATGTLCGDLSNPLLVLPLQPATSNPSVRAQEPVEPDALPIGNLVGAGYQAFENSVLDKLKKAAEKQK